MFVDDPGSESTTGSCANELFMFSIRFSLNFSYSFFMELYFISILVISSLFLLIYYLNSSSFAYFSPIFLAFSLFSSLALLRSPCSISMIFSFLFLSPSNLLISDFSEAISASLSCNFFYNSSFLTLSCVRSPTLVLTCCYELLCLSYNSLIYFFSFSIV